MPMAPVKKKANSVSTADAMLLSQQYLRRRFFLLARTRWGRSTCRYFSLPVMMPAPGGSAPANCPAGGSNKAETRTIEAPSGADANHIRIWFCRTPEIVQREKKKRSTEKKKRSWLFGPPSMHPTPFVLTLETCTPIAR